ncbi:ABC transporter substrate-binding protein [Hymenobacter terricola]|uniref:ABC transporter substrate-binding protein n=1 Tax=Hymenobacter terricola TaxID=2819236 RepID=UPI001B30CB93|nr:ABC transporter substrate-binding protein [Hymenobacter terricola]
MLLPNQAAFDANNLLNISLLQADVLTKELAPALAEALPAIQLVGDSLMKLGYRIKPAAAWDTGRPVLASDVEFTLKLMFCPGLSNEVARNQYRFIRAVLADARDPRRFALVCQGQAIEYQKASGEFFVLSEAALDPRGQLRRFALADLQNRPAAAPPDSALQALARRYVAATTGHISSQLPGCGPYRLVAWEKDRYLTFQRKPHWWADQLRPVPFVLQARPRLLRYVIIPDAATATLALRRGDLDVYPQMPAHEFARLQASPAARASLSFYSTPSYDVVTAGFNTRHPALADAATRRALSRCFDAAGLLRATQLGAGQRSTGVISPADSLNYNDSLALLPFDPPGAAWLLRQAGWQRAGQADSGWFRSAGLHGGRQQLRLVLRYRADESLFATIALQFQATAAGIGIPVILQPTESGAFTMALRTGDFDMYVRVLKGNPFMFNFTPVLHSSSVGISNSTGFSTPASDRLIEAITTADTRVHRARLLRQFQALMQQEAPLVPLFFLPNRIAADRRLRGLHASSLKPGYSAATLERGPSSSPTP